MRWKATLILAGLTATVCLFGCGGGSGDTSPVAGQPADVVRKAAEKAEPDAIKKAPEPPATPEITSTPKMKITHRDESKVEIEGEEGRLTITESGGASIPDGFPEDVPVYDGAKILMSGNQQGAFLLILQTPDSKETVRERYQSSLKDLGWTEKTSMTMGMGVMMQFEKEGRSLILNLNDEDGPTRINIVVDTTT